MRKLKPFVRRKPRLQHYIYIMHIMRISDPGSGGMPRAATDTTAAARSSGLVHTTSDTRVCWESKEKPQVLSEVSVAYVLLKRTRDGFPKSDRSVA